MQVQLLKNFNAMRLNSNHGVGDENLNLVGKLLLAHPNLVESEFMRSVVLMTAHSVEEGALGVILNCPLRKTLGEQEPAIKSDLLRTIPLYRGGPVAPDQVILVAWKWEVEKSTFKLFFGINIDRAQQIIDQDPNYQLRGFLGHCGWSAGQLENELKVDSWVQSELRPLVEKLTGDDLWRGLLGRANPHLLLFADEPDDLCMN